MIKQLFLDTETGGIDPNRHALLEIGALVCIGEQESVGFEYFTRPFNGDTITEKALEVNGKTYEEIDSYPDPMYTHDKFTQMLSTYIDRFDRKDKFFLYGWNVDFDDRFLRAFFKKCEDKYYGSYILWPPINVAALVTEYLREKRFQIEDFHLHTVAEWFAIPVNYEARHGALYDATLTKQVYDQLIIMQRETQ